MLLITIALLFVLVIIFRQSNYRRPALLICLFSLFPLLISPLLLPEFSSQFPSFNRLALHGWQLSSLSLLVALIVLGLYYQTARRYVTPAVHPDRWKLGYTLGGSIIFLILVIFGVPLIPALVFILILNFATITLLRRLLVVDMLFAGMSMGLLYLLIAILAHFSFPSPIEDLWLGQNTTGITLLGLPLVQIIVLTLLGFLWGPLYLGLKEPHETANQPPFELHHLNVKRITSLLFLFIIVTAAAWFGFQYIFGPQKVQANLNSTDDVSLDREISLSFSRPINRTAVRFRISPELEGKWELRDTSLADSVFKTIAFKPQKYFSPNQDYTIEIEDIRTLLQTKQDSYTYTFSTEPIPGIENITPSNDSTQIAACDPIIVRFSHVLDSYWRPEFSLEPPADLSSTQTGAEYLLKPPNCLEQGTDYALTVFNRLESDTTANVPPLTTIRFQTKNPPGLTDHSPKGSGIVTSTNRIEMTFNQTMKTDNISQFAAISPAVTGAWQWDKGGLKLSYILSQPLAYDTRYTVTLKKGLPDQTNGFLAQDTSFTFTTIGPVTVSLSSPTPGSKDVATDNSIQILFNQAVDHASAEERFAIDPNISGSFSWKNNLLTFRPNSSLAYGTNYTVKVKAGVKSVVGLDQPRDFSALFTTKSPPPTPITFGLSEKGRAIYGYKFGNGNDVIFLFGSIHGGKEKSNGQLLNIFVQELAKDPSQVSSNKTIIIVPITNPDGYSERTDKVNSRGVNLNRNFDTTNWTEAGWDTEGSIGTEPFSEKESRVIRDIVQRYGVKSMLAFHSQGGFTNPEYGHAPSQQLAKWYADQTGYGYYQDIGWNFPGTATRWFVEQYGGAGVTVELSSHFVPDWTRHKKALLGLVK